MIYKAYLTDSVSQEIELELTLFSKHWLLFDTNQRLFYGTPPESYLRESLHIRVVASDGYK